MLKFVLVLSALLIPGLKADTQPMVPMPDGRIVGGVEANILQYPHQISMRYNGRHRCGGSIYSRNIIVSAAHCVVTLSGPENLSIVAGSTKLSDKDGQTLDVSRIIYHENHKTSNNDYDVTILVLKGQLTFNEHVQPIALAKSRPAAGTEVIVTGWGTLIEDGDIPDVLQQVTVNYQDNSKCKVSYPFMITDRMLCANVSGGGKDACQGDSGGPLIVNNELLGIVSWGIGCARKSFPGVYCSVPDVYEWIEKTAQASTIEFA